MAASGTNRGPVADARDLGRVEHAVARILAETEQPVEVYDAALKAIGEALGWRLGRRVGGRPARRAPALRAHLARRRAPRSEFEALSEALTLAPGVGLPGRVLEQRTSRPGSSTRPRTRTSRAREAARRGGLHAGFGFPLRTPARRGGRHGVLLRRAARARRAAAGDDGHARQPGRPVRRRPAGRRGGARARVAAARDARGGARRRRDDGRRRPRHRLEPRGRGDLRLPRERGDGRDMAELIVPPHLRDAHRRGLARFLETEHGRRPRPPARADGDAPRRHRVPGRADDHADRAARAADLHRLPARHHRPRDAPSASCARRARAWSRSPTPSASASSATSTTARSSGITSVLLRLGRLRAQADEPVELLDFAIDELAAGLDEIRALASGLHPVAAQRARPGRRARGARAARPDGGRARGAARRAPARAGRGGRLLRRRRGARQRAEARRARAAWWSA